MNPAARTVAVLDLAPIAVFRGDLQGHSTPFEDPVNAVGQRRTPAYIAFGGFHRDITGQGQIRNLAAIVLCGGHNGTERYEERG